MSASDGSAAPADFGGRLAFDFFAAPGAGVFFAAGFPEVDFCVAGPFRARGVAFAGLGGEKAGVAVAAGRAGSFFVFFGTGMAKIGFESFRGAQPICKRIFLKRLRRTRLFAYGAAVRHFVFRWIITTVAILIASRLIPGIEVDGTGASIGAALLLGILNAFIRPILLLLSAPLILLTLGIFILIINAVLLWWVPSFVPGFRVDGFGSAFWGSIIVSLVSWMLSAFFRGSDGRVHVLTHHAQIKRVPGRVVDPSEDRLQ